MKPDEFPDPNPINVELHSRNRWDAIDELLVSLARAGRILPEHLGEITKAVRKRELAMSTGIGKGVAIPHGATDLIPDAVAAIGRSPKGIQFDAIDGKLVNSVLLLITPTIKSLQQVERFAQYAKLLQRIIGM